MEAVNIGIVGLGNVGSGTLAILADNADQIALKLGFRLHVAAVCSRSVASKEMPPSLASAIKTTDWRQVVNHPAVEIVALPLAIVEAFYRTRDPFQDWKQLLKFLAPITIAG